MALTPPHVDERAGRTSRTAAREFYARMVRGCAPWSGTDGAVLTSLCLTRRHMGTESLNDDHDHDHDHDHDTTKTRQSRQSR
ncbi:unnamed protein product [Parajaminaea phylloscopi]